MPSLARVPVYSYATIEQTARRIWASKPVPALNSRHSLYVLPMFPYPSGSLHMGHVRVYTISDCIARAKRMMGENVLHPIGWDAFGLPAENAAIERNTTAEQWTCSNIKEMATELRSLGIGFDWSREISTCDPDYYRYTQKIFTMMFRAGYAYQADAMVNWDPVDKTVLANEQVDAKGRSWRSGAVVERRRLKQWLFAITKMAPELLTGLDSLDHWPEQVKKMQRAWIGKSTGTLFKFQIHNVEGDEHLEIFTTRPETIHGVTYIAISPEHDSLDKILSFCSEEVRSRAKQFMKGLPPRANAGSISKGFLLENLFAVHPIEKRPVPVYIADYVIADYGSGVVMGVPAHDQRDAAFAESHNIPVIQVVDANENLMNSFEFDGMPACDAAKLITARHGRPASSYKLKDWLISRQRKWGAPIPIVHCQRCGPVPVPDHQLPVELPEPDLMANVSSLKDIPSWVHCTCPKCGQPAQRETDTLDTFVDSSWYFLRFQNEFSSLDQTSRLLRPVDIYIGGIEHSILHLLYARFVNRFLYESGCVADPEPFTRLLTQGMVHGRTFIDPDTGNYIRNHDVEMVSGVARHKESGRSLKIVFEKMSKSKYNGVSPRNVVHNYGADVTRLFVLFKAPPSQVLDWDETAIAGPARWLNRLWALTQRMQTESIAAKSFKQSVDTQTNRSINETIAVVTDIMNNRFAFNIAIAELMKLTNILSSSMSKISAETAMFGFRSLALMLAPFAPHISTCIWQMLNDLDLDEIKGTDVHERKWPQPRAGFSEATTNSTKIVVQVSGKHFSTEMVPSSYCAGCETLTSYIVDSNSRLRRRLQAGHLERTIFEPNKFVNFVLKPKEVQEAKTQ